MNNFANAQMMIRKPIKEVFEAFVNPEITTKFWFTKSTGQLEAGKQVEWAWEMYNVSVPVTVEVIEPNNRLVIEWGTGEDQSNVEWIFKSLGESKTFVTINNYNLQGEGDHLISQVRDSTGGFTMVLAGLKAYLEHGIELNLIGDKFPKEMQT